MINYFKLMNENLALFDVIHIIYGKNKVREKVIPTGFEARNYIWGMNSISSRIELCVTLEASDKKLD